MKKILTFSIIFILIRFGFANNIRTTTPVLTGQNTSTHTTFVKFTLTWDNSWRDVVNRDAAWVFIKFRLGTNGVWQHATLSASGHIVPAGATLDVSSDNKGGFIYRSANGTGSNSFANIQLQWNYGADGVGDNASVIVRVFAIEMVYIPQGSFWVGDGTLSNVTGQFSAGNSTSPFQMTSENSLTLGGNVNNGNLGNRNASGMVTADDFNNTTTQTLPAAFPKGYNAFYCIKYEISQEQYVDFLNTLTRVQQGSRVASDISGDVVTNIYVMSNSASPSNRNTIVCPGSGNGTSNPIVFSTNRPDRACNWLSWGDGIAYADWAALRPMTELEFEKICRGDQSPVANEYAWGSTNITYATTLSGAENGTEYITNSGANVNSGFSVLIGGDGGTGPLRCGIFARTSNTREQSGASYYGAMEMSGNLNERCAGVGSSSQRVFDGANGDGSLAPDGTANVSNWPVSGGIRGSNWFETLPTISRTSDRYQASYNIVLRNAGYGFRCVRTAAFGTF